MPRYVLLLGSLVLALIAGAAIDLVQPTFELPVDASSLMSAYTDNSSTAGTVASARNLGRPEASAGAPAIHPARVTSDLSSPAVSEQDVRNYFAATNPSLLGTRAPNTTQTVESVAFLTARQAALQTGGYRVPYGSTGSALVCLVRLRGTFVVSSPNGKTITNHEAYAVFDAHTGNFLSVHGIAQ